MTRRSRMWWWWAAVLFTVANAGGAVFAAMQGKVAHADVHGVLFFVGAYFVWRLRGRVGDASAVQGEPR